MRSAASLPTSLAIQQVTASDRTLRVTWQPDGHFSEYCADWLHRVASSDARVTLTVDQLPPTVPRITYDELCEGEAAVWRVSALLGAYGAVMLSGVPLRDGQVADVARRIGPVQPQIYGEVFDVRATRDPINVAYSTEAIEPHMDLCYYESPPGLQLLHCLEFEPMVEGGDSILIDGFKTAEAFRQREPQGFADLCRIPATFIKDHSRRAQPVLMSYQRPHIALDASRRVVGVFWSPPFEGPLRVPNEDVPRYYSAYRQLNAAIETAPRWQQRMVPGELLLFNNRRMLHGRTAIHVGPQGSARWLQGCYINIDEFANRYNQLRRLHGTTEDPPMQHLGNQDWAYSASVLPDRDGR